jgi:DNA ligase (NAD+)
MPRRKLIRTGEGISPMSQSPAERASELRALVNYHSYRYHILSSPVVTDGEYDALFQELQQIEAEHPELLTTDSPTQRVGSAVRGDLPKVRHAVPVLSLSNAFSDDDMRAWRDRLLRLLPANYDLDYTVEPKFDGLSVVLTYEDGLFVLGATRGDGEIGGGCRCEYRSIARGHPLRNDWWCAAKYSSRSRISKR